MYSANSYNLPLYFTLFIFMFIFFPQQAQQGMEKAVKQLASAGADEQGKAEAQVAVDFHEALIQSVKA